MEFQKFSKIPRLSRDCIISEKLDGTNGQIVIVSHSELCEMQSSIGANNKSLCPETEKFIDKYCLYKYIGNAICENDILYIFAGSKSRWLDITSQGDNYGFAKWVQANAEDLINLGEGRHYGEWWGKGIQRGYGMDEKVFSLFNAGRWHPFNIYSKDLTHKLKEACPECCGVVPILYEGMFDTVKIAEVLEDLKTEGSLAKPGYMNAEGIIIYHTASGKMFKKTIMNDEKPKGK